MLGVEVDTAVAELLVVDLRLAGAVAGELLDALEILALALGELDTPSLFTAWRTIKPACRYGRANDCRYLLAI